MSNRLNFLKAVALFCASIIGAGFLILPYTALRFGFWGIVFYFIILTILMCIIYSLFGRVVWNTKEICSVPGYVGKYLGQKVRNFSVFISATGIVGILLIYIIIGGKFLTLLFAPYLGGSVIFYTMIFFLFMSLLLYIKNEYDRSHIVNFGMLLISFLVLLIFIIEGLPFFDVTNLKSGFNLDYIGLPYGIILFSLWALSTVPEVKKMAFSEKELKVILCFGTLISAIFYLLFTITILGVSGNTTSEEALSGFIKIIGGNIIKIGLVFGLLTILDSFLAFGLDLKRIFYRDARLSKTLAWFFACFLPLSLFLMNLRDFVNIMYVVGAFLFTTEIIIMVLVYGNFVNSQLKKSPPLSARLLLTIFSAFIIFEFWYFFIK